jgi:YHS domain-containing protein
MPRHAFHRQSLAALIFALSIVFTGAAVAKDPVYTARFSSLAVDGYDTVAYFNDGAPAKGSKEFSTEYNGAEWRFVSADNLAAFKADPVAYAPQYGGYCAWAVSQNYTASGNPQNWAIVDGKLYLNYNTEIQERWNKDIPGFIAAAEKNWPSVLQ